MTAPVDLRPVTWVSHDGVIVTVFSAPGRDGTRFFVQINDHGHMRPVCDTHGYHRMRAALREARRQYPAVS